MSISSADNSQSPRNRCKSESVSPPPPKPGCREPSRFSRAGLEASSVRTKQEPFEILQRSSPAVSPKLRGRGRTPPPSHKHECSPSSRRSGISLESRTSCYGTHTARTRGNIGRFRDTSGSLRGTRPCFCIEESSDRHQRTVGQKRDCLRWATSGASA